MEVVRYSLVRTHNRCYLGPHDVAPLPVAFWKVTISMGLDGSRTDGAPPADRLHCGDSEQP